MKLRITESRNHNNRYFLEIEDRSDLLSSLDSCISDLLGLTLTEYKEILIQCGGLLPRAPTKLLLL